MILCVPLFEPRHDKTNKVIMRPVKTPISLGIQGQEWNDPPHDKTNKMAVCPVKTQISLGIRPVWSESLLSAWRKLGSLATHWAHSEDSEQTGRMPRLIWVFAGCTLVLLVLSCRGSFLRSYCWSPPMNRKVSRTRQIYGLTFRPNFPPPSFKINTSYCTFFKSLFNTSWIYEGREDN